MNEINISTIINFLGIIGAFISIWITYKIDKEKKDFFNKLDLQKERKMTLTVTQKKLLYICQNMLSGAYLKEEIDINEKLSNLIKDTNDLEIDRKKFANSLSVFYNAIGLNTSSEKVMVIRLWLQKMAYKNDLDKDNTFKSMIGYSLLYKYLYLDFNGNNIDDLYMLKYNLIDFDENKEIFDELKKEIYAELKSQYNWDNLKN